MESVMKKTAATSLLASCAVSLALFSSCASQEQNTLTPEEIADGWVLLFEGKTLDGWKDYNGTTLTQPWLNGQEMVNLNDEKIGAGKGRIALQIHDGGGIKVLWRNLKLTTL